MQSRACPAGACASQCPRLTERPLANNLMSSSCSLNLCARLTKCRTPLCLCALRRVLDFFNSNFKGIKPYDRGSVLNRMPFDLRSRILQHLYLDVIKVQTRCTHFH